MLSKKAIKEYKKIWKKEYNEDISDEKAQESGTKLLKLFKIIYKPIPSTKSSPNNNRKTDL